MTAVLHPEFTLRRRSGWYGRRRTVLTPGIRSRAVGPGRTHGARAAGPRSCPVGHRRRTPRGCVVSAGDVLVPLHGDVAGPGGAPVGRAADAGEHRSLTSRLVGRARLVARYGCPPTATFVKNTEYAVTVFTTTDGAPTVGKFFARTPLARAGFAGERLGEEVFGGSAWRMPVVRWHRRGLTVPRLADAARLDVAAPGMSPSARLDASTWALGVLLDVYLSGHVHGDLQPHNVWWMDGRLVATDFETFGPRTPGIPFLDSGDVTGNDPAPRPRPLDPAFAPDDDWSFHHVLGVPLEAAVRSLRARLVAAADRPGPGRRRLDALEGRVR